MKTPLLTALVLTLAACGQTQYFAPPPTAPTERIAVRAGSVMINDVSMPEYAINQEIPIQQADGSLTTDTDRLWADLPDRAMQGALARQLNQITDARVAPEPWPLSGFPDIEVTVFINDMIVQVNGTLRMTGTYALRSEDGPGRIETFQIVEAVPDPTSYTVIIAAHEAAWLQLSRQIARNL